MVFCLWEVTTCIVVSSIGLVLKLTWSVLLITTCVVVGSSVSENKALFLCTSGYDSRGREVFLGVNCLKWSWSESLITTYWVVKSVRGDLAPCLVHCCEMASRRLFFDDLYESKDDSQ